MTQRAEDLSRKVTQAVTDWLPELEQLRPEQWRMKGVNAPNITMGEDENRQVGIIVHHIAIALGVHVDVARQLAGGLPTWMPTLDLGALAAFNANHAAENPDPDKEATLQLLFNQGTALAEAVRSLTDEELDRSGDIYGFRVTTEEFVERIAIGHGNWHLSSIRATIKR